MSDKQPIGYLMGLPIYETDDLPDPGEIVMGKLTKPAAQRLYEKLTAGALAESKAILLTPQQDVQC